MFGYFVSDSVMVFVFVIQMVMDNVILNGLVCSGCDVWLYFLLDEICIVEKFVCYLFFMVVFEQIKMWVGEILLEMVISYQKFVFYMLVQQVIYFVFLVVESKKLVFSMVDLLIEVKLFVVEGIGFIELGGEINVQIKWGDLLYVDVVKGYGIGLLVFCVLYEVEKSIFCYIFEGKEVVMLLMERVSGEFMEKLILGQCVVICMILEMFDCFMVVQGYVGVGKIIQFWVVMLVVNMLLESECF